MSTPNHAKSARATTSGGLTLFRVAGFPVQIDGTWLILAGLVLINVQGFLARLEGPSVIIAGASMVLLFMLSILGHELGHAFASLNQGIPVRRVLLFGLGGVTESVREARTPAADFFIVAAGPAISFLLWGVFLLIAKADVGGETGTLVFGIVSAANLILGIFNVVPAYPLDGGRLLRALLWFVTKEPLQATRWAARVGQVLAVGFGIWMLQLGSVWNAIIAFFLFSGATQAYKSASARERVVARPLRDVMGSVPPALDAGMSLQEAAERMQERPSLLWPVGDPVRGGVLLPNLEEVADADRPFTRVVDVALPAEQVAVDVETPLDEAVRRLLQAPGQMLVVVEDGHPVGLLTPSLVTGG